MPTFSQIINAPFKLHREDGYVSTSPFTEAKKTVIERPTTVRRKKPEGWLPPTKHRRTRLQVSLPSGWAQAQMKAYPYTRYDSMGGYLDPAFFGWDGRYSSDPKWDIINNELSSTLESKAVTNMLLKLKQQDVDLGVMFAERNQTAKLVYETATRLRKAYVAVRRKRWKEARRQLGIGKLSGPRSEWMSYRYGITPLLMDVHGSAMALARRAGGTAHETQASVSVTGYSKDEFKDVIVDDYWNKLSVVTTREVRAKCYYVPSNNALIAMSSLGLTNPLMIAWELVPLSFVADWFLPIGDFLQCLDAAVGYDFKGGTVTHRYRSKIVRSPDWGQKHPNFWLLADKSTGGYVHQHVTDRKVYAASPLPRAPVPKDGLNVKRAVDAIALLSMAFRI